ncbi:MAG TPA: GAF domain-containing protein, partial [Dissulfurispiraceae bacterium]|nr:GAF domain-containing protein [Dissulfurispiraceae bacterium]
MNDIFAGIYGIDRRKEERRGKMTSLIDALHQIYLTINSSIDLNERMNRVIFEAAKTIRCESAGIAIRKDKLWTIKYAWGLQQELVEKSFTDNEFPHALIAETKQKLVAINDTSNDDRVNQDVMRTLGIRSTIAIPLIARAKVKGMFFFNYHSAAFSFGDIVIDFANKVGILVSLSLENAELNEDLSKKQEEIQL